MRVIYIKPNNVFVFDNKYLGCIFLSHKNMFFRSSEGYIDMYPTDVGSLILISNPRLIYTHKPIGRH